MTVINRRRVLAFIGAGALAASGLLVGRARSSPPWAAQVDGPTASGAGRVSVAWYETYNGVLLEQQRQDDDPDGPTVETVLDPTQDPSYVPETIGSVLALDGILPGDRGMLATGIFLAERPEGAGSFAIDLDASITADAEGSLVEPERATGDSDTPVGTGGELATALQARVWHDAGSTPCDGRIGLGDRTLASGPLADVTATLGDGVRVCDGCFLVTDHHCLGLEWWLPARTGNRVQTDIARFDLTVHVRDTTGGDSG